jgi:hypothetical protein
MHALALPASHFTALHTCVTLTRQVSCHTRKLFRQELDERVALQAREQRSKDNQRNSTLTGTECGVPRSVCLQLFDPTPH